MSKIINLYHDQNIKEIFTTLFLKNQKVNIWCDENVRNIINDSEFGYILNSVISKCNDLKDYYMFTEFVITDNNTFKVMCCYDEDNVLNIDSIIIV
jgi:hypothetical protein